MLIAQISDLHLRSDGSLLHGTFDTALALDDCVTHVNALDPRPDVVLATGDLVDLGTAEDYAALRPMLDRLAMPVYVIPGNHDDRGRLHDAFADLGYLPADPRFLHYVVERFPLRMIGLDTVLPGEVSGGLCDERLAWLDARLCEQPERPTLVFMHHPPFPSGIGFLDEPAFAGAEAAERVIARHPQVRQVVCGHVHRAICLNWANTSAAIAPSAVYQMNLGLRPDARFRPTREPPAIMLWRWQGGLGPVGYVSLIARPGDGARAAGAQ